jgi:hypothetical protein
MNSMAIAGYKSVDATNPKGYQKPFVVTTQILKYPDLNKMLIQMFMSKCSIL